MNQDESLTIALRLIDQGYAVTSRRYCTVSRIDREDWREWCERKHAPVDADFYRRCVSKDKLTVSEEVRRLMPNSIDARYGFKSKLA